MLLFYVVLEGFDCGGCQVAWLLITAVGQWLAAHRLGGLALAGGQMLGALVACVACRLHFTLLFLDTTCFILGSLMLFLAFECEKFNNYKEEY